MNKKQFEKFYKIIKESGEFDEEYYIDNYFDDNDMG